MQVAVVDDNSDDIRILTEYLQHYERDNLISITVHTYPSGKDFLEQFKARQYSICFLDICMDELDGLSLASQIRAVDDTCLLIFTTSSAEYAVKSYRVRAFDYLLKPLTYADFCNTMTLCKQVLVQEEPSIVFKCGWNLQRVAIKNIVYTDYSNHYIYFYLKDAAPTLRTYSSFEEFAPTLLSYPQFLNCYRNTIINLDEVVRINLDSFSMSTGVSIPMWRNRKQEMQKNYADYLFQKMNGR